MLTILLFFVGMCIGALLMLWHFKASRFVGATWRGKGKTPGLVVELLVVGASADNLTSEQKIILLQTLADFHHTIKSLPVGR